MTEQYFHRAVANENRVGGGALCFVCMNRIYSFAEFGLLLRCVEKKKRLLYYIT